MNSLIKKKAIQGIGSLNVPKNKETSVSAKPIKVGNLSNILAGTELNLRQGVKKF